jgi:hypothetical protein
MKSGIYVTDRGAGPTLEFFGRKWVDFSGCTRDFGPGRDHIISGPFTPEQIAALPGLVDAAKAAAKYYTPGDWIPVSRHSEPLHGLIDALAPFEEKQS